VQSEIGHQLTCLAGVTESALGRESLAQTGRETFQTVFHPQGLMDGVWHYLNARGAGLTRLCKGGGFGGLKVKKNRLDMLAGSEAIDAEIHAGAGEVSLAKIPDFYVVGKPARRVYAEVSENRLVGRAVFDARRFVACSLATPFDFVLIRRTPVLGGRRLANLRGHASRTVRLSVPGVKRTPAFIE